MCSYLCELQYCISGATCAAGHKQPLMDFVFLESVEICGILKTSGQDADDQHRQCSEDKGGSVDITTQEQQIDSVLQQKCLRQDA